MTVRHARKGDTDGILRLMRQLIELHARIDRRYKRFKEYRGLKAYILQAVASKNKWLLVAEDNKKIIGYLIVEIEPAPFYFKNRRVAKIADAAVDVRWRRKGALRSMFKTAIKRIAKRGLREIELLVDARNTAAVAAWKALGFKTYKLRMRRALKD